MSWWESGISEDEHLEHTRRVAHNDSRAAFEMQTGPDRDDYDQDSVADLRTRSEALVREVTAAQVRRLFGRG